MTLDCCHPVAAVERLGYLRGEWPGETHDLRVGEHPVGEELDELAGDLRVGAGGEARHLLDDPRASPRRFPVLETADHVAGDLLRAEVHGARRTAGDAPEPVLGSEAPPSASTRQRARSSAVGVSASTFGVRVRYAAI